MPWSEAQRDRLIRILEESNLGHLFRRPEELAHVCGALDEFVEAYREIARRHGTSSGLARNFEFETFLDEYENNPLRVRVILQAIGFSCSPEILAMMWIVASGGRIDRLSYGYVRESSSRLDVTVELEDGQTVDFSSDQLWDAAVLRFASLVMADEQPLIDSFYPLYLPSQR